MAQRILVVDDEAHLLMTLTANLELEGFEVSEASGGEEALAMIKARPFDLVLSDIKMPGMSGVELFRQVRLVRPNLPVILMTAFAVEGQIEDAIAHGVFTVLSKPFDVEHAKQVLLNASRSPEVLVVVEGLAQSATTMADGLTTLGVRARGVGDGDAAKKAMRAGPVDVCVTDLGAPGFVAGSLDRLKAVDPVVSIIGIASTAGITARTGAGRAFGFVLRPFRLRELIALIAKARAERRA